MYTSFQARDSGPVSNSTGDLVNSDDGDLGWTWYAIKWAILIAILVVFLASFVLFYMHARRRMRQNKPLLTYHRWLVPRATRMRYEGTSRRGTTTIRPGIETGGSHPHRVRGNWPMNSYTVAYGAAPPGKQECESDDGSRQGTNVVLAYNPDTDFVPAYSPPPPGFSNFSKTDPDQQRSGPHVNEQEVGGGQATSSSEGTSTWSAPAYGPPPPAARK